jgi:hypothetical protein
MKTKHIFIAVGLVAAILCAAVVVAVLESREPAQQSLRLENKTRPVPPPQAVETTVPVEISPAEKNAAPSETAQQPRPVKAAKNTGAGSQPPVAANGVGDPLARVALSFVGADPYAEEYWIEAINNADLSADERQNLIEDLNEDGLSDPDNPTADDLPLIVNRIQLIEELAPDAMDDVNAAAFQEAYKDLVNMYVRLAKK